MLQKDLIGTSEAIRQIDEDVMWAARSDAKVLLTGESGVGKEVVARLIHERSQRSRMPLVTINCAGVPDSLLASELFGHARGSFTDAHRDRAGWLEQANRGTVFLDEVGEMSLQMQALLLRFLESGEIQRVGHEGRLQKVDVRVICATNRMLLDRVKSGEFREDLYYRLNVIHIAIPSLRERREDVAPLLHYFIGHFAQSHGRRVPEIDEQAMAQLLAHDWRGNVRELRNVAERMVIRWRSGPITVADLPQDVIKQQLTSAHAAAKADRAAQPCRAETMYRALTEQGENFWSVVHGPFMSRDLTREDLRGLVRMGLQVTRGSYRSVVQLFNMPPEDYKRFLNFLRKHQAHMSVHEFRAMPLTLPRPVMQRQREEVVA
jgi:DNA-binding NtrC family response regulator